MLRPALRLLIAALFSAPVVAAAQAFPAKPVKWIVPFPPGGPTDSFSRPVAQKLAELLGQPVVVENIAGAGASIGTDRLAKSPPDGYTVALATTGTHSINPHLYGARLQYDALKDFTPLTLAVKYTNVLVVHPSIPAKDVGELVAYAKANPGKVTFGSAGNGSSNHLSGEVLKHVTSRWGVLLLVVLLGGMHRFSELHRKIGGVSEKMLAQTLRWLEADGLVLRKAYATVPPHVEYSLTPLGRDAAKRVRGLADWIELNLPKVLRFQERRAAEASAQAASRAGSRVHRLA